MIDDEQNKKLLKIVADNPQSSFLIRMSEGDSLSTGVSVLKNLINDKNQNGIYFTCNVNTPCKFLNIYLPGHDINTERLLVLDTVSIPVLQEKDVSNDQAYFTTKEVMSDSIEVLRNMISDYENLDFVYFDSITEMLKWHSETEIVGFLVQLVNLLKKEKLTGLILSIYSDREAQLAEQVIRYCDHSFEF